MPAIRAGRLTVAVAQPFDADHSWRDGLRVASLKVGADGTTGDVAADAALRTAATVDAYLATQLGRDGVDGRGGRVELVVHAPDRTNAYWDAERGRIELGDGDGTNWGPFGSSVSVVAHELYHGVIDAEVRLDYEQAEQAAIHESLADVFAAGVVGSWRIGGDVITPGIDGDVIRDLEKPDVSHLTDAAKAGGESHALAGIASLAAVRVAAQLGTASTQSVWYRALVDHLPDGAGFAETARATIAAVQALRPGDTAARAAVEQAWESVGVVFA
jgi:Zn-dependent metalloprotease